MDYIVNKSLGYLFKSSKTNNSLIFHKAKYGLYVFYSEASKLLIILTLSMLFDYLPEISIILTMLLIRAFLGGYHCQTYLGCLFSTISTYFFIIFISNLNISFSIMIQILILIISAIIIFTINDPPNPKRNRTKEKRLQNKFIAFSLICVFLLISNFFIIPLKNCINFMIIYINLDYLRSVYYENKKSFQ